MLALGPPRGTARLAIDAGRLHRPEDSPVPAPVAAHERGPGGIGIEARDVAHGFRSRRIGNRCKAGHCQFLSIFALKQPRVALCAWMVTISGLANSVRMPASASPGWVRIASAIIPSLSKPRNESTRLANTGGTSSTYSAGCSAPSVTKIAWLAR